MLKSPQIHRVALFTLLALTLAIAGCFASKYTLIDPDKAWVDRAYVGDWDLVTPKNEHVTVAIRNINDKLYSVDTRAKDEAKVDRYVGFLAPLGTATFAELRPLPDDGSIADGWILMRIELTDGAITLRQLDDAFFKDKTVESAAQLRAIVEKNLDNDAMYAKDEMLTGKKIVH